MRSAFEAWAQRDGHIVRRREDRPDEYLVFETQRRWVIWQAALTHGLPDNAAAPKEAALAKSAPASRSSSSVQRPPELAAEEAALRNRVLNEVLEAFSDLDNEAGLDSILRVIQTLKKKPLKPIRDNKRDESGNAL